jgi:hypothetical protein
VAGKIKHTSEKFDLDTEAQEKKHKRKIIDLHMESLCPISFLK